MQTLNDALVELPYRKAAPLIAHINKEIQRQFDLAGNDDQTGEVLPHSHQHRNEGNSKDSACHK